MEKCVGIFYFKSGFLAKWADDDTRFAAEQCAERARASDPEGCYEVTAIESCPRGVGCSDAGNIVVKREGEECKDASGEVAAPEQQPDGYSCADINFSKLPWLMLTLWDVYRDEDTKAEAARCVDSLNQDDPLKRYSVGDGEPSSHSVHLADASCRLDQPRIDFGIDAAAAESCFSRIQELAGDSGFQLHRSVRTFLGIDWLAPDHYEIVRD
jgi:hypothetical protein